MAPSQLVALVIVGAGLAVLGKRVVVPWGPSDGLDKLIFVFWSVVSGLAFLGMAPTVRYWWASAALGLVLVVVGVLVGYPPIARWRRERVVWTAPTSVNVPAPKPREAEEQAA